MKNGNQGNHTDHFIQLHYNLKAMEMDFLPALMSKSPNNKTNKILQMMFLSLVPVAFTIHIFLTESEYNCPTSSEARTLLVVTVSRCRTRVSIGHASDTDMTHVRCW